jgi:hypothetical protein
MGRRYGPAPIMQTVVLGEEEEQLDIFVVGTSGLRGIERHYKG